MSFTALAPKHFPWFDYSRYTFSLGLDLGGGAAILSGHTASEYDRELRKIVVNGGLGDQVRTAYAKIEAILGAGEIALADVARVVEYVRHDALDDYAEIERVREELLAPARPVVDTVPVRALLRPDAFLEVEVAARRGDPGDPLDGLIYLPSITAPAEGDIAAQTHAALDEAERKLAALGLGLDALTKITQYVAVGALAELDASNAARRDRLGASRPALTQVPVDRLRDPASLLQIDVMASRLPARTVGAPAAAFEALGAAPAVVAGRVLFLSGQGGHDPESGELLHPGDVAAQAEDAYSALAEVLAAAGTDASSLVKTIEYTSPDGLAGYRGVAEVRSRHLVEPWPASTGLVEPRLVSDRQLIEVDAIGVLPG